MDDLSEKARGVRERRGSVGYEPPRVERVLTPAELEREILYAGFDFSIDQGE
jgi:hypothetical protein